MSRGFTLLEVVVALALVGFVGFAAGALLETAAGSAREAEARERLMWVAGTVLDSLRHASSFSSGERRLDGEHRVRWSAGESGGEVEVWLSGADRPWLVLPIGSGRRDRRDGTP